jgi:hypothetical protein
MERTSDKGRAPLISLGVAESHGSSAPAPAEPAEWSSPRRWAVIFAFAFTSMTNGYVCMDFSTSEEISEDALGIARNSTADQAAAADDLKWLYSSIYIVVPVVQLLVAYPLFRYNWSTMLLGVSLNVACAWLRYAAVVHHSYAMGLASSCLAGGAAAVIVSSYSIVPENWFGPSERGLATAIGVQANYLGWGFGVLLPLYVDSLSAFTTFCFWQALAMSLAIPVPRRRLKHSALPPSLPLPSVHSAH